MHDKNSKVSGQPAHDKLLALLAGQKTPTSEEFKQLILALDNHRVLAKVFLLEGTPFVFENRPRKYVIFREQVADRFEIGSQDVCIVGSAKLGYSPSAHKFGTPFAETSDVDVVIISEPLFYRGSRQLFETLNQLDPSVYSVKSARDKAKTPPAVDLDDWLKVKDSVRNFVHQNFNPGLLPQDHPLRSRDLRKHGIHLGIVLGFGTTSLRVKHPEPEFEDAEELKRDAAHLGPPPPTPIQPPLKSN